MNFDDLAEQIRNRSDALYRESCKLREAYEKEASQELFVLRKFNVFSQLYLLRDFSILGEMVMNDNCGCDEVKQLEELLNGQRLVADTLAVARDKLMKELIDCERKLARMTVERDESRERYQELLKASSGPHHR